MMKGESVLVKLTKVGPGCFIPYDKVIIERQGDTGLKVIQPFGARTKERGTIAENTRPLTEIFPCTETGCVLSFKSESMGVPGRCATCRFQ